MALTIRDPGQVGRPTAVPGTVLPFVTAPAEVFTPAAVAEAERQLAAVFAATGLEARFVVIPVESGAQLAAPAGWPGAFDTDGDPDRDILAVIGVTPDGTPVCCLTLVACGDRAGARREATGARPTSPVPWMTTSRLSTAEFRDVALDRFVRGIEDLAPGLASSRPRRAGTATSSERRGSWPSWCRSSCWRSSRCVDAPHPVAAARRWGGTARDRPGSGPVARGRVRRRRRSARRRRAHARTDPDAPVVAWTGDDGQTLGRSRWPARPAWAVRSDRDWVLVAFAAIAGLAVLAVVDLLLPARTDVRLDPAIDGVGVVRGGLSLLPVALIGVVIVALVAYAVQGRWRRRIGVLALAALVGWTTSVVVGQTVPAIPDTDRGWVAGEGGEVVWRGVAGLGEQVAYELDPGEAFTFATTIRNEGFLPLTVLGLDGVTTTQPNPYVASIDEHRAGWSSHRPTAPSPCSRPGPRMHRRRGPSRSVRARSS